MKKEKHIPVYQNIAYVLKAMFQNYPETKWKTVLYILAAVLNPLIITAIPGIAIAGIEEGKAGKYFFIMVLVLAVSLGIGVLENTMNMQILMTRIKTRLIFFVPEYLRRVLMLDYEKVESQKYQKLIQQGAYSMQGNDVGLERLTKEAPELIVKMAGLITYATAVMVLDIRILLILVFMCIVDILLRNHAIAYSNRAWKEEADVNWQMEYVKREARSVIAGKDVRIYRMEPWFREVYEKDIRRELQIQKRIQFHWYLPTLADQACILVRDMVAYYILISQTISGQISPALFTLYLGIINGFSEWVYGVSTNISAIREASLQVDSMRKVMEEKDCEHGVKKQKLPEQKEFSLQLEDVSFRYEDAKEDVIRHLNLSIKSGEKLAIVGNNGAGKTTLVKLLCGLYAPTGGKILLNGKDVAELDKEEYQKNISVLFQDIHPFAFPIAVNISGKDRELTEDKKLEKSLKKVGLWEKINSLPEKENTYITQVLNSNGIQLSGGETQKLLFARAIYKDGSFLILDEPTSALDPIAESEMYEKYNKVSEEKTAVFISHRLASTKFCDRIVFLDKGEIIEEGTHEELLAKGGKYSEIFDIQSHYYKKERGEGR